MNEAGPSVLFTAIVIALVSLGVAWTCLDPVNPEQECSMTLTPRDKLTIVNRVLKELGAKGVSASIHLDGKSVLLGVSQCTSFKFNDDLRGRDLVERIVESLADIHRIQVESLGRFKADDDRKRKKRLEELNEKNSASDPE